MHHLKNKNTKTMYYIYIYQSIPVPRICMRTHVQETSVSVWRWHIKDAFSALAAWSSAPLCILKLLKTLEKIPKHLQVLRPKDRIYFKHLKDHQNSSKPSDLDVCFMNHLCWTSTLNQDFQDLPVQRSFAAKVPSNFSSGWFKELVRINVCSTRSSSSSLALGKNGCVRSTDCDCRLCNLPPPPSPCQPQRLYLAALPSKTCGEPTSVDSICKDNRNCTGRTAWISNF